MLKEQVERTIIFPSQELSKVEQRCTALTIAAAYNLNYRWRGHVV